MEKLVCSECGADTCQTSVEAVVDLNTRRVVEERPHDRGGWIYCPACDCDVEPRSVPLTAEELSAKRALWRRRSDAALEAMVVRAMEVLDADLARHLIANALTPRILAPDDAGLPPVGAALQDIFERVLLPSASAGPLRPVELDLLVAELELIWTRALRGEDVSPGVLAGLRALAESGAVFSLEARERARLVGKVGVCSDLAVEAVFQRGFWTVLFCSPCAAWYAEHGQLLARPGSDAGRVLARGTHSMLEVAAELCRRALGVV